MRLTLAILTVALLATLGILALSGGPRPPPPAEVTAAPGPPTVAPLFSTGPSAAPARAAPAWRDPLLTALGDLSQDRGDIEIINISAQHTSRLSEQLSERLSMNLRVLQLGWLGFSVYEDISLLAGNESIIAAYGNFSVNRLLAIGAVPIERTPEATWWCAREGQGRRFAVWHDQVLIASRDPVHEHDNIEAALLRLGDPSGFTTSKAALKDQDLPLDAEVLVAVPISPAFMEHFREALGDVDELWAVFRIDVRNDVRVTVRVLPLSASQAERLAGPLRAALEETAPTEPLIAEDRMCQYMAQHLELTPEPGALRIETYAPAAILEAKAPASPSAEDENSTVVGADPSPDPQESSPGSSGQPE